MQWISVEERLPEEGDSVLVGRAGKRNPRIAYLRNGFWGDAWELPCFEDDKQLPTHWQPLPEPPKASGPFFVSDDLGGARAVYHREMGYICNQDDRKHALRVRNRLNELWAADKGHP